MPKTLNRQTKNGWKQTDGWIARGSRKEESIGEETGKEDAPSVLGRYVRNTEGKNAKRLESVDEKAKEKGAEGGVAREGGEDGRAKTGAGVRGEER